MTDAPAASGADHMMRTARVIQTSPEILYRLFTDSATQKDWRGRTARGAISACEIDAQVGGRFRHVMWIKDLEQEASGQFLEVSRPHRLVFTWTWTAGDTEVRDTIVTIEFTDLKDGSCRVSATQQKLPSRHAVAAQAALWSNVLQDLAIHVATAS